MAEPFLDWALATPAAPGRGSNSVNPQSLQQYNVLKLFALRSRRFWWPFWFIPDPVC